MKRLWLLLLLATVGLVACAADVDVDGVWGRVSPMAASNGAFYMEITNNKDEADALVAVRTDSCETVELHESQLDENGVMRMSPAEGGRIPLPPGETVKLESGGLHVMCIGMERPLVLGAVVPLTLEFAHAETRTVDAEIRSEAP